MQDLESRLRWQGDLAPGHVRRDGALMLGGVRVEELARAYSTPVLILDGDVLEAAVGEFMQAAKPHGMEVAYAAKALLLIGLARVFEKTPLRIDVCSLGELVTAERAGVSASRLSLHGCGKTSQELDAVAAGRVGRTIVDNIDELEQIGRRASADAPAPILLRINTGIEAHTHAFVQTGGDDTKFGIAAHDFRAAAEIIQQNAGLLFLGLHSHIGSQIYETGAFVANVHKLMEAASQFTAWSLPVAELIVGGGFGIESGPDQTEHLDIAATIDAIAVAAREHAKRLHLPVPKLGVEPGRAIVGRAGTSLYRVMAKKHQAQRTFLVVDGGIADNPRPALYDAYHHAVLASRASSAPLEHVVVCGRSCENDRLTEAMLPEDIEAGDLLAVCTTGAYTYSMASNYNRFTKPAVVFAKAGMHHIMARRETVDDVLRHDVQAE